MFSAAYKRYALAGLTAVWTLNLVDRGLMMLFLQPIKEDFRLSDTQLGFLTGIAFGLFYAVLGIPIARWADRGNRVRITSLAICLWGMTVMASPLVSNYLQFAVARIAAAVGEAGCKPPTYSLIGDYFPQPLARTRAMAVYMTGGPLAALLSFVVGGWLNGLYGWRATFFIMGVPGLLLAVVVRLTMREPRVLKQPQRDARVKAAPMTAVFGMLWHQRSSRYLGAALILLYTLSFGMAPWYSAFLMRSHGMQTHEVGLWLGLIISSSGAAGILTGGYLANLWFSGNERGQMRLCAATMVALVPCFIAFLMLPSTLGALLAFVPLQMVFSIFLGPAYALMQRLVPDEMRATVMAVVMLLVNLIGMGIGPQLVGILSDLLIPALGQDSLRYAMLVVSLVAMASAYYFWQVGRSITADLAQAEQGRLT